MGGNSDTPREPQLSHPERRLVIFSQWVLVAGNHPPEIPRSLDWWKLSRAVRGIWSARYLRPPAGL